MCISKTVNIQFHRNIWKFKYVLFLWNYLNYHEIFIHGMSECCLRWETSHSTTFGVFQAHIKNLNTFLYVVSVCTNAKINYVCVCVCVLFILFYFIYYFFFYITTCHFFSPWELKKKNHDLVVLAKQKQVFWQCNYATDFSGNVIKALFELRRHAGKGHSEFQIT